jgi:hypothetical protein
MAVIHFKNQGKSRKNMKNNGTEYELPIEKSPEILWEEFEQTGSVQVYLKFLQKAESSKSLESADIPT